MSLFLVLLTQLKVVAGLDDISLGPIGGVFEEQDGSSYLRVTSVQNGAPGDVAGLQVGDFIYKAFGEEFGVLSIDTKTGYIGSVQDFGEAIERAEAGNGLLPLTVLRPNVGNVDLNVQLSAVGGFGPAYPLGSPKHSAMYQTACDEIHALVTADSDGGFGYNTGIFGMILLSHPNWNDTSGGRPYRNSINKMRDWCVSHLGTRIVTPVEAINLDGSENPSHVNPGLENWTITTAAMFLAEYRRKTSDSSVDTTLQTAATMLENRIQIHQQPPHNGVDGPTKIGLMGHGGIVGDYPHVSYSGINIINAHVLPALALLKNAGATVDASKFDACWQRMRDTTDQTGGDDDGNVGYGWVQGGYDSGGRTAGAIFGMEQYGGVSAADQAVIDKQKAYIARHWQRMQHCHAYTVGGTFLYQLAIPYLSDRQQRFIMENQRHYYQFHRNASGTLEYLGGRENNGGDTYLNENHAKLMNAAMTQAVHSGNLPSFPAINSARLHADFKAPVVTWPSIDARACVVRSGSAEFNVDITNYLGTVLNTTDYTASWSHVSGPATAGFSSSSTASTTVTFPASGKYRIQLEVTKDGYTLTEPIDVSVFTSATPSGYSAGYAEYRVYEGVAGTTVSDLTGDASYPNSPTIIDTVSSLEGTHSGNTYGSRIRGYIIPQTSGDYTFYIASDDASEFKFGATEATATKICEVFNFTSQYDWYFAGSQTSAVQTLTAGTPYFFEVNHKEGSGGDHLAVAWSGPGFSTPTVIDGDYLAVQNSGAASFVNHPSDQTVAAGSNTSFNVAVTGQGPFLYEWFLDGVSYWPASSSSTLALENVGAGLAGVYECKVTTPNGSITSNQGSLTVTGVGTLATGGLWREVYEDIGGGNITDLTTNVRFPKISDSGGVITTSEAPSNAGGNYGQRWTGWVKPDVTGNYTFYITSDDASELWLSSNDQEGNKVRIASLASNVGEKAWSAGGKSTAIALVAGNKYYIEVRHKEGGGGDHCAVTWQKPGEAAPTDGTGSIASQYLEHTVGGTHVAASNAVELALVQPMVENVRIRPNMGLALQMSATPALTISHTVAWTKESGPGVVTFENTDTLTTGATFSTEGSYILRCTVDNGGAPVSKDVTVIVSSDPVASWTSESIAEPTVGSGSDNGDGTFTVLGSGNDIFRSNDTCQFYYQTLSGDFDVRARVSSKSLNSSFGTHAQLMARETLASNSRNVAVTHERVDRVAFQYRLSTSSNTTYRSIRNLTLPVWIRLVRSGGNPATGSAGQTFTGYYSTDNGATWTQRETVTYTSAMPENLHVGFAVASGGSSLNTVVYDNVSGFQAADQYGPEVAAGADSSVDISAAATLSGSATDDGFPASPGTLTTTWSKLSGSGNVTFANAAAASTTATFDQVGSYVLRLTSTDGETTTYDDVTVTVTTSVNVDLTASDASAAEVGPDAGTFTFTRSGATAAALTVNYTISGSAINGTDYTTIASSVEIPIGSSTATVTITPTADALYEGDETVTLTLASGIYNIGTAAGAVTITDHPDNDGDGLPDAWEIANFGDLTSSNGAGDADSDGVSDSAEQAAGTNPSSDDSDSDGYTDKLETTFGTNPNDNSSTPDAEYLNLHAWWKLDETSGTVAAEEVRGADGIVNQATWIAGIKDNAIEFDGVDDQIQIPVSAALTGTTPFTVSLWVKTTATSAASLLQQRDESGAGFIGQYAVNMNADGTVRFYVFNSGFQFDVSTTASVNDGQWNHLVAVRDGDNAYIYINGVLSGQASGAVQSLNALQLSAGYDRRDSNKYLDGALDDIRIYARALSQTDAQALIVNEAPVVNAATFSVDENVTTSTPVGAVAFTDVNAGDSHTFSITAGNIGNAFQIDSGGNITTAGSIDYEAVSSFSLTVEVTDNGVPNRVGTATITINVNDIASDDSDGDGLDDAWEVLAYGSTTAQSGFTDKDLDGYIDIVEVNLGSDPSDPASKPGDEHQDLLVWLPMNEGAGSTTADATGFSRTGNLNNSPTWVSGIIGSHALSFDGVDQSVAVVPPMALNSNTVTFTAWVKREGNQSSFCGVVFARGGSAVAGIDLVDNKLRYHWDNSYWGWDSGLLLPDGEWAFVALAVEPTKVTMHMVTEGGVIQSAENVAAHALEDFTAANVIVGSDPDSSFRFFKGEIDEVRIFNRTLDQAAVVDLMQGELGNLPPTATSETFSLTENVATNTEVGTVQVSDPNGADTHTFSITSGNDSGVFAIDNTGKITTAGVVDYETATSHTLTVAVVDSGAFNLATTATITINIQDLVNDDSDGDNIADEWEISNFSNITSATASSDADNDGQTDLGEYQAGTDPNNAADLLKITDLQPTVSDATVKWSAKNGKSYKVMYSYNLVNWFEAATGQASTADGEKSYVDNDPTRAAAPKVFYMIEVE